MTVTPSRSIAPVDSKSLPEYSPTTYVDFSKPDHRAAFEAALASVRAEMGKEYPLVIGGERLKGSGTFDSTNPAHPSEVLGRFQSGTVEQANRAIDTAFDAFRTWSRVPAAERAAYLVEAARRMRERRHWFSAWMVLEVGKSWGEADADTAEAIDFMEFYAREMLRYDAPHPIHQMPGEKDTMVYLPIGVGAVIPPWNFPLAICVGMTTAAIVTGNTVVVKPASDTPAIAWQFHQLMEEVGLPPGVFNFVTGAGGVVGDTLVRHPKTRFVSFTGSKPVGIGINKLAAEVQPGQIWLKRVVAEMGGKDAILIDDEADLDAAALGVAQAAFGFGGQKCSACSRAIVVDKVHDAFVAKLMAVMPTFINVGDPAAYGTYLGPVASERAMKTILSYIDVGKTEGKLLTGGARVTGADGWFVQPTVFDDIAPTARLAQEEIFGPVLAIIRAKDYDDALAIANNTEFGLTGAVYTKNATKLERARHEFFVGNLYLNRKCTGAMVGCHPFGGFNMSGTDSKAGGRDYLLLFLQAKSIAEKIG
ncbi:MAG: L-glutamate gamma-semialdehyde dehydrogenase [Candidatus Eisenbacteria bacterium]|uniref:L-glutamate gamma-semialdehyde dehydrogenase n=1 Tax=Eiseniibacteriota bacterium TaxID=2212470 RepID=A0A849STX3_UNCEI|nr:L-glutamate gamma-semialdehyde dehydrogenase [Candidatus Eisenbacteria bacterium]